MNHDLLHNALIYLAAAIVLVPLTHRLGLGSVLGYILGGVIIGPFALGWIDSSTDVLHFSEFGVVMLLFLVGLELNPRRLWALRRLIFGLGATQVLGTAAILAGGALLIGVEFNVAVVAGLGLAMSSTALVIQLMNERGLMKTSPGEATFSILLFQDLAVIPIMALLPLLDGNQVDSSDVSDWMLALKGFGAIATVILIGRFMIRPAFRWAAATQLREVFTALALGLVIGISILMHSVGLSMALGAFLAGVVLADSEYRHELEIDIQPFKGLLMGLFFIAVGMSMDLSILGHSLAKVIGLVLALIMVKALVVSFSARIFGHGKSESATMGLALCQGGEFAFVLFGLASTLGMLKAPEMNILNLAIVISIALTPILFKLYERHIQQRLFSASTSVEVEAPKREGHRVILAGYGRIGQGVGRLLHSYGVGVTVLEQDPTQIEIVRKFGWKTYYGDVSRLEMLEAAGAADAELLILAIDDMEAAHRTIELIKSHFPHLKILVRAENRLDAYRFAAQGIETSRVTMTAALEMGERALKLLGTPAFEARRAVQWFKHYDDGLFKRTMAVMGDEKAMISLSKESRDEVTALMAADAKRAVQRSSEGWG